MTFIVPVLHVGDDRDILVGLGSLDHEQEPLRDGLIGNLNRDLVLLLDRKDSIICK